MRAIRSRLGRLLRGLGPPPGPRYVVELAPEQSAAIFGIDEAREEAARRVPRRPGDVVVRFGPPRPAAGQGGKELEAGLGAVGADLGNEGS